MYLAFPRIIITLGTILLFITVSIYFKPIRLGALSYKADFEGSLAVIGTARLAD